MMAKIDARIQLIARHRELASAVIDKSNVGKRYYDETEKKKKEKMRGERLPLGRLRKGEHFLLHNSEIQGCLVRYRQAW